MTNVVCQAFCLWWAPRPKHILVTTMVLGVLLTPCSGHSAGPRLRHASDGDEVLGFIKGDPAIIRTQLEIGVVHLRNALVRLDGVPDIPAIQHAARLALLSYRMLRFAQHGTSLLTRGREGHLVNPLYPLLIDTITKSRLLIVQANLSLQAAEESAANNTLYVQTALEQLTQALSFAEQAQLLI